jgi:hypothetical protein
MAPVAPSLPELQVANPLKIPFVVIWNIFPFGVKRCDDFVCV